MRGGLLRALGTLALAVGAPLLLLGALEAVAWAFGIEPLAANEQRQQRDRVRACRWDPARVAQCGDPRLGRRLRGRSLIFVLGGSSVVGHPGGETRNIPHYLRRRLDAERPRTFVVRSLARPCKDSIYVRRCAEHLLRVPPDFLVVYSGHNDFSGHTSRRPGLSIWIARHGWPLLQLERRLSGFRFWSLLSRGQANPLVPALDPGFALPEAERARVNETILEHYTENLSWVIERAGEQGTRVVLVSVVANLHDFPFRREQWDAVIGLEQRKGDSASPALRAFADGVRAYREGRFPEALRAFESARDLDPRTRAPGLLNARIRELAAAHEHVHLVDFEPELARLGLRRGVGCNFFGTHEYCDGVHINPQTSARIGRAVAERILELGAGARRATRQSPSAQRAAGERSR